MVVNLPLVRAKANANYTCQECGSTELIQAHHQIPGDDDSLIVLCAECHSKRHPDMPRALFFSTNNQPYWHNKSASSLAKELEVHSRTVIRTAKRLDIGYGRLASEDEELIKNLIIQNKPKCRNKKKLVYNASCLECGGSWIVKGHRKHLCPFCGSYYYNITGSIGGGEGVSTLPSKW